MKYIHNRNEVPKIQHYAIMEFSTYTVPGDERSRTHPGHGYPAHTESTCEYIMFEDRAEWEKEVKRREASLGFSKNYVAIQVIPATIQTEIVVNVKESVPTTGGPRWTKNQDGDTEFL